MSRDYDKMAGYGPEPKERMSDERLAQLQQGLEFCDEDQAADLAVQVIQQLSAYELLNAIKAEREEVERLKQSHIHCDVCGSTWYDDGFTGSCPNCRLTRLVEHMKHIARHYGSAEQCRELAQAAIAEAQEDGDE